MPTAVFWKPNWFFAVHIFHLLFLAALPLFSHLTLSPFLFAPWSIYFWLTLLINFGLSIVALIKKSQRNEWLCLLDVIGTCFFLVPLVPNHEAYVFLMVFAVLAAALNGNRWNALIVFSVASVGWSVIELYGPQQSFWIQILYHFSFFSVSFLAGLIHEELSEKSSLLGMTQKKLIDLQQVHSMILANIRIGVCVMNDLGVVEYANESLGFVLKHTEILQKRWLELVPEMESSWKDIRAGLEIRSFERYEIERNLAGDEKQFLEFILAPLLNEKGQRKGWLCLVEDRTETKTLEEQMRVQEKLAAVGQLAAGIAHEIRNPLASISGSLQMILGDAHVRDEQEQRLMKIVLREIDRLNDLINEFMDYVRPSAILTERVDVNSLLREILELAKFNPQLPKNVVQEAKLDSATMVMGNSQKLKQAFLNIIVNAFQALDKVQHPKVEVITKDEGNKVIVLVKDNGVGISTENIKRIFEPFHTTKPKGTGLGLAITYKILEAHKAKVFVDSQLGQGTQFLIELPSFRDEESLDWKSRKLA